MLDQIRSRELFPSAKGDPKAASAVDQLSLDQKRLLEHLAEPLRQGEDLFL